MCDVGKRGEMRDVYKGGEMCDVGKRGEMRDV